MSMLLIVLVVLFAFTGIVHGQDYRFIRDHGVYKLVEPKETIVVVPPVDTRPFWLRLLRSLRPYTMAAPGTRFSYNEDLDIYQLNGAIGVGIKGKVEF
jgi:hypothetical protein